LFYQSDDKVTWDELPLGDALFDHGALLSASLLGVTQQITGGEMLEPVVLDEVVALGSFTGAGATDHEVHSRWRGWIDAVLPEFFRQILIDLVFAL
jgi:hypothetical protein